LHNSQAPSASPVWVRDGLLRLQEDNERQGVWGLIAILITGGLYCE